MKDKRDININTNGTSYQGCVVTTARKLTEVFGEPEILDENSGAGKVNLEWVIKFKDGTIATIYAWKRYELGTPELDEVVDYHVGGFTSWALVLVVQELKLI